MAAGGRRRCWPLVAAGAACTAALCPGLGAFAHGAQRSALVATRGRVRGATQLHAVEPVDIQIGGLENFTGNSAALWTTFLVVFLCFPGVVSTINRTGQWVTGAGVVPPLPPRPPLPRCCMLLFRDGLQRRSR
ncbi:unnamed protein product [Prorocentrum cordatum]|uniref:Uncharacterized protein n=1 Tax=Prorocentrum cordatum TaxID=2364126 RepID=A0ABN9Q0U4_9DINO|nr:unnamed protein product [Polarella glacialis]